MLNYRTCEHNKDYLVVEVFNKCDIEEIKEKFIKKGYTVLKTTFMFGSVFIEFLKRENGIE